MKKFKKDAEKNERGDEENEENKEKEKKDEKEEGEKGQKHGGSHGGSHGVNETCLLSAPVPNSLGGMDLSLMPPLIPHLFASLITATLSCCNFCCC